jgi:wobble nucleotide-excising tRNase
MPKDAKVSELFSSKQAAEILNRTPFCIWYHSTRNLDPVWVDKRLFLTKSMMRKLVEDHLRLKPEETREGLMQRVAVAKP